MCKAHPWVTHIFSQCVTRMGHFTLGSFYQYLAKVLNLTKFEEDPVLTLHLMQSAFAATNVDTKPTPISKHFLNASLSIGKSIWLPTFHE